MEPFLIIFDSHVHIYDCYNIKNFFHFVLKNFGNQSKKIGTNKYIGVLFLTETKNENYFQKIRENYFKYAFDELNLKQVKDNESVCLLYESNDNNFLIIVPGKQIITSEKLEVLAVGTNNSIEYGISLKNTIEKIKSFGALPIIPWGVGKWIGKKHEFVKTFLDNVEDINYFLGDNGGRPLFWPTPGLFKIADKKGIFTLRGSDPLPLIKQEEKVGKFGFYIRTNFDFNYPAKEIKNLLLNIRNAPNSFGNLETPVNFFKNQFSMQLRKIF